MEDSHELLLDTWANMPRHIGKCFIRDGIIDPSRWFRAPRKILFILREAYGEPDDTEGWDLREVIREEWQGPKGKVWWTVSYWAYGILTATPHQLPPFPSDDVAYNAAKEALLSTAAINIKKSGGKSSSDWDDLVSYVNEDGEFIRQQVELINPQIAVCGNVWSLIQHLWQDAQQLYDGVWIANGRVFIDFWHPANYQFPNQLCYYALSALLQNSGALNRTPLDIS
ncbi:MAG: hypothetical protein ABSH41_16770 [Syntrophobacteraceae bacterium]